MKLVVKLFAIVVVIGGICYALFNTLATHLPDPQPLPATYGGPAEDDPIEKMNEVGWSAQIARDRGLDPEVVCEIKTPDGMRCDLLTQEYAYEVEWASSAKWKEAPGQAVYYGLAFNRKPGIILLHDGSEEARLAYLRCAAVAAKLGIRLEVVRTDRKVKNAQRIEGREDVPSAARAG